MGNDADLRLNQEIANVVHIIFSSFTQLGLAAWSNTLLNLVRSIPLPPIVTPQTLGVDDFCFRSGKTYGTALIGNLQFITKI
uniref:Transposase n=1 Tax=Tolypothrix bouteillei VB521301 TaxID=1479485 RepID=A0A0C1R8X2_9CYAN